MTQKVIIRSATIDRHGDMTTVEMLRDYADAVNGPSKCGIWQITEEIFRQWAISTAQKSKILTAFIMFGFCQLNIRRGQ